MKTWEISRSLSRIIAGETRVLMDGQYFYIKQPTKSQRAIADEVFYEQYRDAERQNLYTEDQLKDFLAENDIWTGKEEKELKTAEKNIEEIKVGLLDFTVITKGERQARELLKLTKYEFNRLLSIKHSYDHISCLGIASAAKSRYLFGCSIYRADQSRYFLEDNFLEKNDNILTKLMGQYGPLNHNDNQIRAIARSAQWQELWRTKEHCGLGVFNCSSIDLTEDQRNLAIWSGVYDIIREHPQCPSEKILQDDDLVDGWLIKNRREREKAQFKNSIDGSVTNKKLLDAKEQFRVVGNNMDSAAKIISLNEGESKFAYNQRIASVKQGGGKPIPEQQLADTQRELQMKVAQRYKGK